MTDPHFSSSAESIVEPLPCPFCGTAPKVISGGAGARIQCLGEECFGPSTTANWLDDAVFQWNKRMPTDAQSEKVLVSELADVAESHFLPTIKAQRQALLVARDAIWSGGDTILAITTIDAALAHPGSTARTAPESCPNCINEDDCASVDICRAVEEVNSPPRSSAGTGDDISIELRGRLAEAKAKATESAKASLNSYGAGYDLGYHDALGEFLEYLTDRGGAYQEEYTDILEGENRKLKAEIEQLRAEPQEVGMRPVLEKIKDLVLTNRTHSVLDQVRDVCDEALAAPEGQLAGRDCPGVLESDPALFNILNNALGTMHYHRLMSALNWNGYVIAREPQAFPKREDIGRAIYDVTVRWVEPNFPKGHKLRPFDELDERETMLHLEYADAVLGLLASSQVSRPESK